MAGKYLRSMWDVHFMSGAIIRTWTTAQIAHEADLLKTATLLQAKGETLIPQLLGNLAWLFRPPTAPEVCYYGNSLQEVNETSPMEKYIASGLLSGSGQMLIRLRQCCADVYELPTMEGVEANGKN